MIRRPLIYITPLFAAAILVSYYLGTAAAIVSASAPAAVFLFGKAALLHRNRILLLILVSYCLGIVCFSIAEDNSGYLLQYEGQPTELFCRISQIENRSTTAADGSDQPYLQIKAAVEEINGAPAEKKACILIRYYEKSQAIIPGNTIRITGALERPAGRRNPGCFDYALYLRSTGITMIMTAETMTLCGENSKQTLRGSLYMIKEKFLKRMEQSAGKETAGLMRAIMFGEKSGLEEDTLEEFQKNGTAHVLAVSGLHVGIIYGFITLLWRWKKGCLFFGIVTGFFFCYMVMASFSPSVVRAVCMVCLHCFARLTGRRYDLSSAAFLTALLMLMKNPMQLFNAGFQMSFLAVLTLSLLLPVVKRFYSGLFLGSLAVQLGLLPYTVYTFNYLSLTSVFVNVPVIFLTGIIVPAGMCSMLFMAVCPPVFDLISALLFGLCRIMTAINAMTGIDGVTVFYIAGPGIWVPAVYYLLLLCFVSEEGRLLILRRKKKSVAALAALVVLLSFAFHTAAGNHFKDAEVVFVDVGQGDCIHFRTEDGGNYLVDGGGSIRYDVGTKTLKPYLLKNGVTEVDGAFVSHLHTDHYRGIAELCREGMVKKLFLYEGNRVKEDEIRKETGMKKEDLIYLYRGQQVTLAEDAMVQVLWPGRESEGRYIEMAADEADENMSSLILKICVKGRGILATGDVDEACLDGLAEIWKNKLNSHILKAAHHGSKYSYSEDFAERASPQYAVFQVGKNNFGHPDKGVIENYLEKGIMIYRNDEDGAVGFDFTDDGEIEVMTVTGDKP